MLSTFCHGYAWLPPSMFLRCQLILDLHSLSSVYQQPENATPLFPLSIKLLTMPNLPCDYEYNHTVCSQLNVYVNNPFPLLQVTVMPTLMQSWGSYVSWRVSWHHNSQKEVRIPTRVLINRDKWCHLWRALNITKGATTAGRECRNVAPAPVLIVNLGATRVTFINPRATSANRSLMRVDMATWRQN